MNIGIVGLGKLGKPVAVTIDYFGHNVMCYDLNLAALNKTHSELEQGFSDDDNFTDILMNSSIEFGSLEETCSYSDILFIAVQTPHDLYYEGINTLPESRVDFNYTYLKQSLTEVTSFIKKETCVSIISTCLPGTVNREIIPIASKNKYIKLYYTPQFIAMGTVLKDFCDPEFWLIGKNESSKMDTTLSDFFSSISRAPQHWMSISSAELTKVAYNTFISTKLGFVNTLLEICYKLPGTDIDDVMKHIKIC